MKRHIQETAERSNAIYDAAFSNGKTPEERVLWGNAAKTHHRRLELIKTLDQHQATILEVGCGNGGLYSVLRRQLPHCNYTGIDINNNLLKEACARFPEALFLQHNILETDLQVYDYVIMSGVFNANFGQNLDFVHCMIERMFKHCKIAVVFDAISTHVNMRQSEMFYIDPAHIITFISKNISPYFFLKHFHVDYNYIIKIDNHAHESNFHNNKS